MTGRGVLITTPTTSLVTGYLILALAPAAPLLLTWYEILKHRGRIPPSSVLTLKLPLAMLTVSCLLFFSWLAVQPATNVIYSQHSSLLIYANSGVAIAALVLALLGKDDSFRASLAVTAAATAFVWFYLWAMSAVA
jgi:hypothetical protein